MFKYVASTANCPPRSIFLSFLIKDDFVNDDNKPSKNLSS